MTKPIFTTQVSVGNLIQIGVLIVGLTAGYVAMQAQTEATEADLLLEVSRGIDRDLRLRTLELKSERADERYNSIMTLLQRIDKALERMERQQ